MSTQPDAPPVPGSAATSTSEPDQAIGAGAPQAGADAIVVDTFVAHVRRRALAREVARGTLAASALLFLGPLVAWTAGAGLRIALASAIVAACAGLALWLVARAAAWREPALLTLVESRQPAFRNLLVTARELAQHPDRARPAIRERVVRDAARVARDTPLDAIVPPRDTLRALGTAAGVLLVVVLTAFAAAHWSRDARRASSSATVAGGGAATKTATRPTRGIRAVTAIVTPPSYTGRPAITLRDPARIEALAGSHLQLDVDLASAGGAVQVAFNERAQILEAAGAGRFRGALVLGESGVLTVAARDTTANTIAGGPAVVPTATPAAAPADAPRVIAVTVTPDQPPTVDLVAPGRDLLFDDGGARVELVARARDDLGMRALALRYTKVSGSGEQYEFQEGELPLAIARTDARQWQGRVARAIRELKLNAGDLFVYYAVATDARGDEGRAVSDSYVIEIGKPGVAIAGGFAIPPDEDRFAISLNALIQRTGRLHAKRAAMPAAVFAEAALALAVEQRMVRTEFLFTMGFHGHVQDEEVEAAHSHEIQEGRLENRGQAEMVIATRLMTRAERQLTGADTGEALTAMRGALAALQRALSRHRYFLRTLLTSSEIDPGRRLTGDLSAASSARWPARDRPPDERAARARAVLIDLARLARGLEALGADDSPRETPSTLATVATMTASRLLALDPTSAPLQAAAASLTQVAHSLTATAPPTATTTAILTSASARESLSRVRQAADAVLPLAGPAAPKGGTAGRAASDPGLRGAVVDALRERGGSRPSRSTGGSR